MIWLGGTETVVFTEWGRLFCVDFALVLLICEGILDDLRILRVEEVLAAGCYFRLLCQWLESS